MTKQDGKDVPELGYLPHCIGEISGCKVAHCHYAKRCDYNSTYPGKK